MKIWTWTSLSLIVLASIVQKNNSHHIIFEQLGELAPALTYLHLNLILNLTAIEDYYLAYTFQISALEKAISEWDHYIASWHMGEHGGSYGVMDNNKHITKLGDGSWEQAMATVRLHQFTADHIMRKLETLRNMLPQQSPSKTRLKRDAKSSLVSIAKVAAKAAVRGVQKGDAKTLSRVAMKAFRATASSTFS